MYEIRLHDYHITMVDEQDVDYDRYKWYILRGGSSENPCVYARRYEKQEEKRVAILLHREILERIIKRPLAVDEYCDHVDHDGLNNQRDNLRLVSHAENLANQRKPTGCSSHYKGVSWHVRCNKWQAQIMINYHKICLGYFESEIDAARAYDRAARRASSEYAYLNFPDE